MAWINTLIISQVNLWPGIKLELYTGVINTSLIPSSTTIIDLSPPVPMDCKPNERQQRAQNTAEVQQRNHSNYHPPPRYPPSKVDQGSMDLPDSTLWDLSGNWEQWKSCWDVRQRPIYIINTYSMSANRYRAGRIQCDHESEKPRPIIT